MTPPKRGRKADEPTRCSCCGSYAHELKDCNTARALDAAIMHNVDPAY
jgi:queuine/archaeosine tRNA-ribosyltransferase